MAPSGREQLIRITGAGDAIVGAEPNFGRCVPGLLKDFSSSDVGIGQQARSDIEDVEIGPFRRRSLPGVRLHKLALEGGYLSLGFRR